MLPEISKIKGLHPGIILKRELKLKGIKNSELANSVQEFPQKIGAIIKEKRGINPSLSVKLAKFFNVEEDYFMQLQASFDVKKYSSNLNNKKPD